MKFCSSLAWCCFGALSSWVISWSVYTSPNTGLPDERAHIADWYLTSSGEEVGHRNTGIPSAQPKDLAAIRDMLSGKKEVPRIPEAVFGFRPLTRDMEIVSNALKRLRQWEVAGDRADMGRACEVEADALVARVFRHLDDDGGDGSGSDLLLQGCIGLHRKYWRSPGQYTRREIRGHVSAVLGRLIMMVIHMSPERTTEDMWVNLHAFLSGALADGYDTPALRERLYYVERMRGDYRSALAHAREAVARSPSDVNRRAQLAHALTWMFMKTGSAVHRKEALEVIRACADDAEDPEASWGRFVNTHMDATDPVEAYMEMLVGLMDARGRKLEGGVLDAMWRSLSSLDSDTLSVYDSMGREILWSAAYVVARYGGARKEVLQKVRSHGTEFDRRFDVTAQETIRLLEEKVK